MNNYRLVRFSIQFGGHEELDALRTSYEKIGFTIFADMSQ